MGMHDRDYWRNDSNTAGRRAGSFSAVSANTWIIGICVAVFVLDALLRVTIYTSRGAVRGHLLTLMGHFSAGEAFGNLQLWRLITFQFLHADLGHIVFNMLGLYVFGSMVENMLGRRRYVAFYLLCGVAGPLMYMVLLQSGILSDAAWTPMVGASAGVFGVLIAAARTAPNALVQMLFPPVPVKLKTLAWIMVGIAVFIVISRGNNSGGEAAHLGGAAAGFFLIGAPHLLDWAERFGSRRPRMRLRR